MCIFFKRALKLSICARNSRSWEDKKQMDLHEDNTKIVLIWTIRQINVDYWMKNHLKVIFSLFFLPCVHAALLRTINDLTAWLFNYCHLFASSYSLLLQHYTGIENWLSLSVQYWHALTHAVHRTEQKDRQ